MMPSRFRSLLRRRSGVTFALLLIGLSVACDSGPKAGELEVLLDSPDPDDRAVMFELTATEPLTIQGVVEVCSGCQEYVYQASDTQLSVIVLGTFGAEPIARVAVSDVTSLSRYTLSLESVAGVNLELQDIGDRNLTLDR